VHHRDGQQVGVRATEVAEQRKLGTARGGLGHGERDAEDRVRAVFGLVRGAVEIAERLIVPSSRATSTSTVGLPRESRISRAPTASMLATGGPFDGHARSRQPYPAAWRGAARPADAASG